MSVSIPIFAQEILTAEEYFDTVSENYGSINDYIADIRMVQEDTVWEGTLYYKRPNMLRIDFSDPDEMVISSNGETLIVYYPDYSAVFEQALKRRSPAALAEMASAEGLALMKRNYSLQYLSGPEEVSLGDGIDSDIGIPSDEPVKKLRLTSRTNEEGFRQLDISIGRDRFIRRIIGVTFGYEEIQFDFENIRVNQNIPDARFDYDPPASANVFRNFLGFETES